MAIGCHTSFAVAQANDRIPHRGRSSIASDLGYRPKGDTRVDDSRTIALAFMLEWNRATVNRLRCNSQCEMIAGG